MPNHHCQVLASLDTFVALSIFSITKFLNGKVDPKLKEKFSRQVHVGIIHAVMGKGALNGGRMFSDIIKEIINDITEEIEMAYGTTIHIDALNTLTTPFPVKEAFEKYDQPIARFLENGSLEKYIEEKAKVAEEDISILWPEAKKIKTTVLSKLEEGTIAPNEALGYILVSKYCPFLSNETFSIDIENEFLELYEKNKENPEWVKARNNLDLYLETLYGYCEPTDYLRVASKFEIRNPWD